MEDKPTLNLNVAAHSNTQTAAFEMLLSSISSCLHPVVQQLISSDSGLVYLKGWHGMTALHRSCLIGDYNVVLMLIQANSDVNAVTDFNETPLHYACKRGIPTIVHLLLQCGAKFDMKDGRGRSALHHAAECGSVAVIKYLEDVCNINTRELDGKSQSALHIACTYGQGELFQYLMKKGRSDLRQEDSDGNLAIHLSAREGNIGITWKMFNILGVSVLKKQNKAGYSLLDLVQQKDTQSNHNLYKVLRKYSNLPEHTKIHGTVFTWYALLFGPFSLYAAQVCISQQLATYQFLVFVIGMVPVYMLRYTINHRVPDISRWPNPVFVGFFYAGVLHSTICYLWLIFPYMWSNVFIVLLTFTLLPALHYLFFNLVLVEPTATTTSAVDPQTGRPVTIVDLCTTRNSKYKFCVYCDIIVSHLTKHCKLCGSCYYRLDHHCLYVLRCITSDNHPLFCWLIILAFLNMIAFNMAFVIYSYLLYPNLVFTMVISEMVNVHAWPSSLLLLNMGGMIWCAGLLHSQFEVVTNNCTAYFHMSVGKSQGFRLTKRQQIENFVKFLMKKPLKHQNPNSPFAYEYLEEVI